MKNKDAFTQLKQLSLELKMLTNESDANIASIKFLSYKVLAEIDDLKEDSISAHVNMTKMQAREYMNQGLAEIIKYNDKSTLRSIGNFVDVIRPIQAGLEIILNLNY